MKTGNTPKAKLIRITTVPVSMNIILKGQLAFMNQYFEVVGVTSYDEKHFNDCAKREGIRMIPLEMERSISPLKDIISLWKLYKLFRKEKPQIVHTHTPKAGLLGMMAAKLARIPVRLHTVGGMPLTESKGLKRFFLGMTERITYYCSSMIYPNSFGLLEIIKENHFCNNEKLKVIANGGSNGINADYFNPLAFENPERLREDTRRILGISEDDFVFLYVGRIAKEKGISELFTAFSQLQPDTEKPVKLLMIGTFEKDYGVLDEETKQRIIEHPAIITPGRFDDVRPYYMVSDTYVLPSYREGFPNTLLEAGAMELPIITTDINGCNEIVKDNFNGVLVPVKDVVSLKNAMSKVLKDDGFRVGLKSKARSFVVSRFRRELIWDGLLNEYQSFLRGNGVVK